MASQKRLKDLKGIRGALYRIDQLRARTAFAADGIANFLRLRFQRDGARPSVAAVMVGRNDDYMSDFIHRLRATIAWNAKYLIDEVVFVEWNPPADRELLSFNLTKQFDFLRAYVVSPEVHRMLCENTNIALLEYHAKNVGIRRAQAPWMVSTNADAAFALDSVNNILSADLSPHTVWNTQRVDIPWREGRQSGMTLSSSLRYRRISPYSQYGTGEFCLASRELWHKVRGFDETMVRHRIGCDVRGTAQMMAHGAQVRKAGLVLHLAHPTSCSEGVQPHHGEHAPLDNLPYRNKDDWGLGNLKEVEIAERVWQLE
jgi:hypothetical protein